MKKVTSSNRTHFGFGFTMKRTASMLFSRRMGGVAKEALMLVQSDLGPDEPIPSFLGQRPMDAGSRVRDRCLKAITQMRELQVRLHQICLQEMKDVLDHCEHCTDHQLILAFLMTLLFPNPITRSCFEHSVAKLPLLHVVSYRLFTSLISSCYSHYALSCDMSSSQNTSLKHAITSILVPKRSKWVCREALFSLVTSGHLLSPHLFLNYRHVIEYLLYVRQTNTQQRTHLSQLWYDTLHLKWGPFFRLRSATKHLGFEFEDPFVLVIHNDAYSVDDDFHVLKHTIRDSYS